jgi:hypothetical protein
MTSFILRGAGAFGFAAATFALATGLQAQESTNRVSANTDWSVFVEAKECWGVSKPKETVNTRDGKSVEVRRGEILLFVTYTAGGGSGVVSFSGGYPFADGSTVKLTLDSASFDLFTDGEFAFAKPEDDGKIVEAMKSGAQAVVTGKSGKGTSTKDTFSLLGFTASVTEAAKRCAV